MTNLVIVLGLGVSMLFGLGVMVWVINAALNYITEVVNPTIQRRGWVDLDPTKDYPHLWLTEGGQTRRVEFIRRPTTLNDAVSQYANFQRVNALMREGLTLTQIVDTTGLDPNDILKMLDNLKTSEESSHD